MALCGTIKHHNKNEKPCVLGFWHFLTSESIAGFSASLSAFKTKRESQDSLFLCLIANALYLQRSDYGERERFMAQWKSTGDVFFVSWYFVSLHYEHT